MALFSSSLLEMARFGLWVLHHRQIRTLSPEYIQAVQEQRLRKLLYFVSHHSSFYRDKYRGLDLGRCSLSDLPPVTKDELMEHFDQVVTDPRLHRSELECFLDDPSNIGRSFWDDYTAYHTSGSQGPVSLIVQDRMTMMVLFALQYARGNVSFGFGPLEPVRRLLSPVRVAVIAMKQGFYPSAAAWEHIPAVAHPYTRVLRLGANDPDLIEQLNVFRPMVLSAYAGVLGTLVLQSQRLRLAPDLRQVVSYSDTLSDQTRNQLAATFGVPVLDTYASGECLFLTTGCPTNRGAHVNADWAIVEVVDKDYRPVPSGTLGHKVLITNLANRVQPFIRYELGDRVAMATEPCHCGSRLPRIERIEGRTADILWVKEQDAFRPLPGETFKHALEYVREVREWQAEQTERNRIRVLLELLPGTELDRARARRELDRQLDLLGMSRTVHIDLEVVPHLTADTATGKFRRITSRVGNPPELRSGTLNVRS